MSPAAVRESLLSVTTILSNSHLRYCIASANCRGCSHCRIHKLATTNTVEKPLQVKVFMITVLHTPPSPFLLLLLLFLSLLDSLEVSILPVGSFYPDRT